MAKLNPLSKRHHNAKAIALAEFIKQLMKEPTSRKALAEITGLHYQTILMYCSRFKKAKLIHIGGWEQKNHVMMPCFYWGNFDDVEKPKLGEVVRVRTYRRA